MTATTMLNPRSRSGKTALKPPGEGKVSDDTIRGLIDVFRMLADKNRLKILFALAQEGTMHVSAICEMLGQSQPAVSHHLTLMRMTGLVSFDREGKHNFYRLASAPVCDLVDQLFSELGNGNKQIHFDECVLTFKRK